MELVISITDNNDTIHTMTMSQCCISSEFNTVVELKKRVLGFVTIRSCPLQNCCGSYIFFYVQSQKYCMSLI